MRFRPLIQQTLEMLAPLPCQAVALPETFRHIARPELDGILVMETQFFRVAEHGQLRLVHIYAPKINILTLFFFPDAHWQLPIYCLELVVLGIQPIVALLDCVCLMPMACSQPVADFMAAAHHSHPDLNQAANPPDWFGQCRSGADFFLRPDNEAQMAAIGQIHLDLLAGPMQALLANAQTFCPSETVRHQQLLQAYKHHHHLNAPGLRLMNRSFGEQWTADYMAVLFQ